ncbi:hypothetical protein F5Y10DRAFT_290423 [Nemania abortiva]|nr:hypothetical protein F5Y10DRAFT_290423 [Nemania abortiva]
MELTVPERRRSRQGMRQWTPSLVSENKRFDEFASKVISVSHTEAEDYDQSDLPQPNSEIRNNPPPGGRDSTLQLLQDPGSRRETKSGLWKPWLWEIVNCCLLLISLFAILATLYPHDGQPLPQWPLSITINALLSIYTVVMKANMLLILASGIGQLQWSWFLHPRPLKDLVRYREAAEGPIGSISWLYRHHIRQPLTALAALIMIAAVGVDPFIHQLVQPVDCKQPDTTSLPSIPRTNYLSYDTGSFPSDLLGSIASGYYTPRNLSDFTCSTGNCTFSTEYSSLAYCSVCEDASDTVQIEEHCMILQDGKVKPGSCYQSDLAKGASLTTWNITTTLTAASERLSLNYYYNIDTKSLNVTTPKQNIFGIGKIARRLDTSDGGNTISFISLGNDMGIILAKTDSSFSPYDPSSNSHGIRMGCDDAATNNTWWCRLYGASTCSLQPCVRSYVANVEDGRLTETLVSQSEANMTWGYGESTSTSGLISLQNFLSLVDTQCINDAERQNLTAAGYTISNDTRWLPYNLTFNPRIDSPANATFPESLLAHRCLYTLDAPFNSDIWTFMLDQFMIGIVQSEYPEGILQPSYIGPTQLLSMFDLYHVNETTINNAMGKLADAMTLWIRAHGHPSHSERAVGEEFRSAICVKVNWDWVALPATLTGLTLAFFFLMVISTNRQQLPIWKGSPLTLLFHGPGGMDWVNPNLVAASPRPLVETALMTDRGMREFADRVTVRVTNEEDESLCFRQVEPRPTRKRTPSGIGLMNLGKKEAGNDDLEYSDI